ncbi:MAG: PQQ-binding-like beta-propeller repeat protein [Proteobacteria bacterium]|nr:PQQ-binding-like beta-propeller repeat protein [Pseudomonadota bacterium]
MARTRPEGRLAVVAAFALAACSPTFDDPGVSGPAEVRQASEWPHYGGDAGGQRYAELAAITPANVDQLEVAWTYHTGDVSRGSEEIPSTTAFQNTPILVDGRLFLCTPFNRVIALDPVTGAELWAHDPEIDLSGHYANQLICRGVTAWRDPQRAAGDECAVRIFTATNDAYLIALDAETGRPCSDFADAGRIDLNPAAGEQRWKGEYQVTSPPVVAEGLVITGSAVGDNQRWNAPSGLIRGFDARTGALRWSWDLSPPGFEATPENTSAEGHALGTPNAWAPFSVDAERGLVFVPTGNPMLDYSTGAATPR